jgi:hypothetical protein
MRVTIEQGISNPGLGPFLPPIRSSLGKVRDAALALSGVLKFPRPFPDIRHCRNTNSLQFSIARQKDGNPVSAMNR